MVAGCVHGRRVLKTQIKCQPRTIDTHTQCAVHTAHPTHAQPAAENAPTYTGHTHTQCIKKNDIPLPSPPHYIHHTDMSPYTCTHTRVHTHTNTHVYTHTHNVHRHTCTHTHVHTDSSIYNQIWFLFFCYRGLRWGRSRGYIPK